MAEAWNHLKKDYRARFCHGGGTKIDVQPGQSVLKLIQDCFESCSHDLTINSPNATCRSTDVVKNEKRASTQNQRFDVRKPYNVKAVLGKPQPVLVKAASTNSGKRACKSPEPSPTSLLTAVSSRGQSCDSFLKPAIHDYLAGSKKPVSPVFKSKKNTLKDVEAVCRSPTMCLDPEDDHRSVGSPFPVEEAKSSPVVKLCFDGWNTPAAGKSCREVEHLEGPQTGRDEQAVLVQGTEPVPTSSVQKEKTFSSALLAAVSAGTLRQRYSASVSPSPPPVKGQDIEIENECEFLIDEASGISFTSWISISGKKKKSKKDGSATSVSKSKPSDKKTQSRKGKNRKPQVEAPGKPKLDRLDVGELDFRGMSEPDPVSDSERNVLKSQSQKSTHMGKTKKGALRQDSPNQKKNTSWKPEAEELMSWSVLETEASHAGPCKTKVLPSEELPMTSPGYQKERTVSPEKSVKSSKNLQSASKGSQHLIKLKFPKVQAKKAKKVAVSPRKKLKKSVQKSSNKKPQLPREESSDNEPGEEELEREPVKMNNVCTTPLHQKLETPMIQKLAVSEKPRNALHTLESPGGANNQTPVKALHHPMDSVKNSEKKQLPAKYSGKIPKKIPRRTNKAVYSSPEDTESQTDSDSSSVQDTARKKRKLSDVKIKNNKRKHNRQHGPQDSFAAEKALNYESGPVLEHCDKFASSRKSYEQDDTSSDNAEDLNYKLREMMSDDITRHKIVMPSNTPNVRRTKRIRLRPLEYWRGERVNYAMNSSGGLVISGVVHPQAQSPRKSKQRKDHQKQKTNKTNRREIPASLDHNLADTSKPTVVLDPVTNEEVLLECISTGNSHACFFEDEAVKIHKNLNTSVFATGRLILKPFKEKGYQCVNMDTIAFHIICGKIIATLHKTSYYLTTGDSFYVPAGNEYNIRNLLNEESVLLFTQLKVSQLENLASSAVQAIKRLLFLCNSTWNSSPQLSLDVAKIKKYVVGYLFPVTLPAS